MSVMEIRKTPSKANVNTEASNKAVAFVTDVKNEIKKIHWTDKEELKVYTKLVVAATFIFGMSVYLVDLTIQGFLVSLNAIFRFFL